MKNREPKDERNIIYISCLYATSQSLIYMFVYIARYELSLSFKRLVYYQCEPSIP